MEPSFGFLLKSRRLEAELTQEALAERAGISVRSVRALERGASKPQRETAARLADALDLDSSFRRRFMASAAPAPRRHASDFIPPSPPAPLTPTLINANKLPLTLTPMIGRAAAMAAVEALLRGGTRLLTVTGPGGVGKTRLALEVARKLGDFYPDGLVFVALDALSDPAQIRPLIAARLNLPEQADTPLLDRLSAFLRDKSLLLILDNFEHLLAAALQIGSLLAECPTITLLITSRSPLRLQGEQLYPLAPLSLPDGGEVSLAAAQASDAAQLFAQRAALVRPGFSLNADNAAIVGALARRLDGLPLALELAAGKAAFLSPQALLDQAERPLQFLCGGPRDLPPRQQSLRSSLDWSYALLTTAEQAVFRRLALCSGAFTIAEAQDICAVDDPTDELAGVDLIEVLLGLAEKNMLQVEETPATGVRFIMLATTRDYALERLQGAERLIR